MLVIMTGFLNETIYVPTHIWVCPLYASEPSICSVATLTNLTPENLWPDFNMPLLPYQH